jgi:hypothetical protein
VALQQRPLLDPPPRLQLAVRMRLVAQRPTLSQVLSLPAPGARAICAFTPTLWKW